MKIVSFYYSGLKRVHLFKDVGQVARSIFLRSELISDYELVSFDQELGIKDSALKSGINYRSLSSSHISLIKFLYSIKFLIFESKNVSILNVFHPRLFSFIAVFLFKVLNPQGITYLKMDMDKRGSVIEKNDFRFKIVQYFLKNFVDVLSIETKLMHNRVLSRIPALKTKLIYVPNGIGDEFFDSPKDLILKKENVILYAGRIGVEQKNTELFLNSLTKVDLNDWSVVMVGEIVGDNFRIFLDSYFLKYPKMKEKIVFTGLINDRDQLIKLYDTAKVFCSTSLWESFGIAIVEAMSRGCHVVSTRIESIDDISDNGSYVSIVDNNDDFYIALSNVINNTHKFINEYSIVNQIKYVKDNFYWENSVQELETALMLLNS